MIEYETPSGIVVHDRRHARAEFDDPRGWTPNASDPVDPGGVGPNDSEGFGNTHVMYPAESTLPQTSNLLAPEVQAWSGWPVEWNTPTWGAADPLTSSKVSTVFGVVDLNSSIISSMPPYRLQGTKVVDPLPWMANPQPEVYTGWIEAMKQVITSYWCGEAFLWATSRYAADNSVRQWVMLDPAWVEVRMMGQIRRYYMSNIDITEDVLHLRYSSWPGQSRGFGPLSALANNLFSAAALEKYQGQLATRGGIPWGVLTAPGNLKKTQAEDLRASFVAARLSAMGAPAVMSGGVTLTPFSLSPRDMALLELRQFDEARISVLLGAPPLLLGLPSGDSMTYKNAEGIYDFHWRAYLRPRVAHVMEAISHWALPSTQSVELNRDDYVRPAFNERVTGYQTLFNIVDPVTGQRGITVEEIRRAERLAVLDDAIPVLPELAQQLLPDAISTITTGGQG